MKLLISLIAISLIPKISIAQDAPKKANVIIIETADSIDAAFKQFGRILINEGYEMEQSDKTFFLLTTKVTPKKYGMGGLGSLEMKLYAQFDEKEGKTVVKIYGKAYSKELDKASGGSGGEFDKEAFRIENKGAKGSIAGASWKYMNDLTKKYPNGKIDYQIE